MRYRIVAIIAMFVLLTSGSGCAGELMVRRTFFTAWKYSIDGETYHKVGTQAEDLRLMMADYRSCISALNGYRTHMAAAKVTGAVTLLLVAYVGISALRGGEWADGYTPATIVAASIGLASVALEESGSRSLKRATRLYNQYTGQANAPPVPNPSLRLSLRIHF